MASEREMDFFNVADVMCTEHNLSWTIVNRDPQHINIYYIVQPRLSTPDQLLSLFNDIHRHFDVR